MSKKNEAIEVRLPLALYRRIEVITAAGVLGSSRDEVITHMLREVMYRDWLLAQAFSGATEAAMEAR